MNKRIDFTQPEGLGVTQDLLDFMQVSYRGAISAIATAFGNKVILFGVTDNGTSLTSGWVCINGEMMPFTGGLKEAYIDVIEATDFEEFGDLSTKTVYYTKTAKSTVIPGYAYTDFRRMDTIIDMFVSLQNLITSFTIHTHDWADITGKPTIPEQKILRAAKFNVGDVVTQDQIIPISFTDLGTDQYVVTGTLVSLSSNYNVDNDVVWMAKDITSTGFKLCLRDLSLVVQNLRFDYALIKI